MKATFDNSVGSRFFYTLYLKCLRCLRKEWENKTPDYRHTLLWMPMLETEGMPALTVPFSTSSLTGDFQVTVEGITKDGKIIKGVSFFNVKN